MYCMILFCCLESVTEDEHSYFKRAATVHTIKTKRAVYIQPAFLDCYHYISTLLNDNQPCNQKGIS